VKLLEETSGHRLIELFKVLGRWRAKFNLIHLPFQAPTAGQFSRGNILPIVLRFLKIL
jgi:hypothetical protein